MYQRLGLVDVVAAAVSFIPLEPLGPSGSDSEHEGNRNADHLIRHEEENRRNRYHHEHHGGCNRRFAARRPGHLARLFAHFLEKLEWGPRHSDATSILIPAWQ